jgi:hypothetical protein
LTAKQHDYTDFSHFVQLNFKSLPVRNTRYLPAHMEMMGFLGTGNNPMVGMTVDRTVAVIEIHN